MSIIDLVLVFVKPICCFFGIPEILENVTWVVLHVNALNENVF